MLSEFRSYIDRVLAGEESLDDIDVAMNAWIEAGGENDRSYLEFLGMEWREYQLWVERPESLEFIVEARRRGITVPEALHGKKTFGLKEDELKELRDWVKRVDRW